MIHTQALLLMADPVLVAGLDAIRVKRLKFEVGTDRMEAFMNALEASPQRYGAFSTFTYASRLFDGTQYREHLVYALKEHPVRKMIEKQREELYGVHGALLEVLEAQFYRLENIK